MKRFSVLIAVMASAFCVPAQCLVNSLIINTGYNPVSGTAVTAGMSGAPAVSDPYWIVTAVAPGISSAIAVTPISGLVEVMPTNNADVIAPTYPWITNPPDNPGNWISCLNSNTYTTDGTGPTGTAYYMTLGRPFRLCSADSITISFFIANDNYISHTDIDGTPLLFSQPTDSPLSNFEMYTYFIQTLYLPAGSHTINVEVNNYNPVGLRDNPTGLNIYGTIASATMSNSLISESDPSCDTYSCSEVIPSTCDSISLQDTIHQCFETPVTLPALLYGSDSVTSIAWTPATGISDPSILDPTVTAPISGWYYIAVNSLLTGNLIVNGSFSAGNTGFTSSYTFEVPPVVSTPGHYGVTTNPAPYNPSFPSFGDHTTSTGNMLLVDGAPTIGTNFWCETISVMPHTNYTLSVWSALIYPPEPEIQLTINGLATGLFSTASVKGQWINYQTTWNSGSDTSADICFLDLDTAGVGNDFAIDDISLQQICTAKDSVYVAVNTPGITYGHYDTGICTLVPAITLNAPAGYASYFWNTGATTTAITADTGIYWVNASVSCASFIDTFNILPIFPATTTIANDTSVCSGKSITLSAPPGYNSFNWSTGATATSITVAGGTYWVQASVICSMLIDTFSVATLPSPVVSLGDDTAICEGISITLNSPQPAGSQYQWSNGSTDSSITVSTAGTYSLTVTQNACSTSDSVQIAALHKPAAIGLGHDTTLCTGEQIILSISDSDGSLLWNAGDKTSSITISQPGNYWVTASNICGNVSDTINVNFELCNIWFPSAFTPNGDGLNDIAHVVGNLGNFADFSLSIYNRWGQRIFYTQDIYEGWNGKFNGVNQDIGTYFYMIFYTLEGKKHMMKGNLELIR